MNFFIGFSFTVYDVIDIRLFSDSIVLLMGFDSRLVSPSVFVALGVTLTELL